MDMDFLKNWKSQATAIFGALFVVFNQFYPNILTAEQETEIVKGILALFGLFLALKMSRKGGDPK